MRPKFFPASVLPVLAGSAWGFMAAGQFDLSAFILALLATVCVHAGANVLNDVCLLYTSDAADDTQFV